jgi:hypothetical protein
MTETENTPLWIRCFAVFCFALGGIVALVWLFISITDLYNQVIVNPGVVYFEKGVLYALGAGIFMVVAAFGGIYRGLLKLPHTNKVEKRFTVSLITSIVILFVFPHIFHYFFEHFIVSKGYSICEQASYQWLHYREIVYTLTEDICTKL